MSDRTALYRLRDGSSALLYVGITNRPHVRFGNHRIEKPWWPDVEHTEVEWFETRAAAMHAETIAIRHEHPKWNKAVPATDDKNAAGRAPWSPPTPEIAERLEALKERSDELQHLRAEIKAMTKALAIMYYEAGAPITIIAAELGLDRKTVYRFLGRPMS